VVLEDKLVLFFNGKFLVMLPLDHLQPDSFEYLGPDIENFYGSYMTRALTQDLNLK